MLTTYNEHWETYLIVINKIHKIVNKSHSHFKKKRIKMKTYQWVMFFSVLIFFFTITVVKELFMYNVHMGRNKILR